MPGAQPVGGLHQGVRVEGEEQMAEEEQWDLEGAQQTGLGSAKELQQCTKVMVTLAGDETTMLSQNRMGATVVPPEKGARKYSQECLLEPSFRTWGILLRGQDLT